MLNLNLNLKLNELSCDTTAFDGIKTSQDKTGIAVIGIDAKVGSALTKEEIWQAFANGLDMITELPEERVDDAQSFAKIVYGREIKRFSQRAYLPHIDKFDPAIFKIAPTEAELMDPVQRMYLESAWAALEDAGYGGSRLRGSTTGVYVGYNNVGQGYDALLKDIPNETVGIMLSGNVCSFLASRLSYLLDLTGPAMVIDTACSSSLVALHEACRALKAGDIKTAVVGSIRIFLCPEDSGEDIGTTSSSERTKTFDEAADGTGGGEGVINLVLKPLAAAIEDKDHIYGVIKGSCVNQDGSSIGITAPNSAAQEKAILQAWKEADVHPEDISYIEAHGTATKLGDPVEIGGLTAAFSHFTDKKQFCAIGASKSNFGHLDCASGLLGVLKVLLMMQHRTLAPSVHFRSPNRKIDYLTSPVYINDTLKPWKTDNGILTAGVSSFGLSGTNCHVVLQSYDKEEISSSRERQLLTASAMDRGTLKALLLSYQNYLKENPETSFESFCYTLNTGRGQHRCRFAMVFENASEFIASSMAELEASFADFRIVSDTAQLHDGLLTVTMQEELSAKSKRTMDITELSELYRKGAEIDFTPLYEGKGCQKLSLPTYPFHHQRCWFTPSAKVTESERMHPLIDRCAVRSRGLWVYEKEISTENCMELREHRINGVCVLPGTVYVEIAHAIGCDILKNDHFIFSHLTFLSLLTCDDGESRRLHAIVHEQDGGLHIGMSSCGQDGVWVDHIEAILHKDDSRTGECVAVDALLSTYETVYTQSSEDEPENFVKLGEHWQTGTMLYVGDDSVVLKSEVGDRFRKEAGAYRIYPPMLDGSMNTGIMLLNGQYLPLSYKNARFYGNLNDVSYSHIRRKGMAEETEEIALFDVQMFDEKGNILAAVEEYALKRVNRAESFLIDEKNEALWQIEWTEYEEDLRPEGDERAIVFLRPEQDELPIVRAIKERFKEFIAIRPSFSQEEIANALRQYAPLSNTLIVNLLAYCADGETSLDKLQESFVIAKALGGFAESITYALVTLNADCVTGKETVIHPLNKAVVGFASCLEYEQGNLEVRIIDSDETSDLLDYLTSKSDKLVRAVRDNRCYIEQVVPAKRNDQPVEFIDGDVIVIAGGYGGIGLSMSEHIFANCPNSKIVLLSRNGVKDDERKKRLEGLRQQGCQIEVACADVTDFAQLHAVTCEVRERFGRIDGAILAAGIAGDGMLLQKSWQTAQKVLAPKILGASNLMKAASDAKYTILCSSFTSAVGAPGQTDYTAANAYLDALTFEANRQAHRTMTINWTGWSESGMAKAFGVDADDSFVKFVTDEEGKELFADALSFGCERVIACRFEADSSDAAALERRLILPKGVMKIENEIIVAETAAEAPIIYGKAPDKLTAVEQNIALAWARTLHVTEVNIYDKFFEAGGNSLLASYLQKEINRIYPDTMAITDVFVYSTISDIAAYISGKLGLDKPKQEESASDADIEDLVQQFMSGKLSIEDMENLV